MVERQVYLNSEEIEIMKKIKNLGKEVFLQAVPTEKKLSFEDVIKEYTR